MDQTINAKAASAQVAACKLESIAADASALAEEIMANSQRRRPRDVARAQVAADAAEQASSYAEAAVNAQLSDLIALACETIDLAAHNAVDAVGRMTADIDEYEARVQALKLRLQRAYTEVVSS